VGGPLTVVRWPLADAATAMGAHWGGAPDAAFDGAVLDSREVRGGELFFALPGERTDGHRFVPQALAAGAAAAVVAEAVEAPDESLVRVGDTTGALHALTRRVRERVPEKLIAVTGSAGKTTTKELLGAMLGRRFRVARSPGNLNNLLGFPLALLNIPDATEWMVAEMGMSVPGELAEVSRLGRPDAALFTNVRPVHLENFADLDAIAEAKAELLAGLAPGGLVIANAADPRVAAIARRALDDGRAGRVVWYAADPEAEEVEASGLDVWAERIETLAGGGSRFALCARGAGGEDGAVERIAVELPLIGRHNVENCVAAAAAAHALGVPLAGVVAAAAAAWPSPGRGVVHALPGGIRVVDDTYNSNPDALRYALATAAALAAARPGGRRWAVLGSMLELGAGSPGFHREAGERAAAAGFSPVAAVGEEARELAAAAAAAGAETAWLPDAAAAADWAAARLAPGDTVLVKGSRGIGLEAVVARLLAEGHDNGSAAAAGAAAGAGAGGGNG
jgi:UDP-N-acetylmuramoyl-tripeptide--D-alanyl-D-alanine ligase